MNQTLICPCCGEELKINISMTDNGEPIVFLLDKKQNAPTIAQLNELGYEFGVIIENE